MSSSHLSFFHPLILNTQLLFIDVAPKKTANLQGFDDPSKVSNKRVSMTLLLMAKTKGVASWIFFFPPCWISSKTSPPTLGCCWFSNWRAGSRIGSDTNDMVKCLSISPPQHAAISAPSPPQHRHTRRGHCSEEIAPVSCFSISPNCPARFLRNAVSRPHTPPSHTTHPPKAHQKALGILKDLSRKVLKPSETPARRGHPASSPPPPRPLSQPQQFRRPIHRNPLHCACLKGGKHERDCDWPGPDI